MSDPITVHIVSQKGFTIKNNLNDVDAKAVLYRGGDELDSAGTAYTYTWKLWNAAGSTVVKPIRQVRHGCQSRCYGTRGVDVRNFQIAAIWKF